MRSDPCLDAEKTEQCWDLRLIRDCFRLRRESGTRRKRRKKLELPEVSPQILSSILISWHLLRIRKMRKKERLSFSSAFFAFSRLFTQDWSTFPFSQRLAVICILESMDLPSDKKRTNYRADYRIYQTPEIWIQNKRGLLFDFLSS